MQVTRPKAAALALLAAAGAAAPVSATITSAPPAAAAPPAIEQKRAEAQRILAQVAQLDRDVERAAERYNLASLRLGQITSDIRANTRRVDVAQHNLTAAQRLLASHLVTLYTADEAQSDLEVLLGAEDLSAAIDKLDAQARISNQDTILIRQVRTFRTTVLRAQTALRSAKARQQQEVRRRAEVQRGIERRLRERRTLLAGVQDEVARLQAAERARQERLRREAEARLAAQQREAARRAAAEQAARQAAVARGETPPPPEPDPQSLLGVGADTPDGPAALPPARYGGAVAIAMRYLGVPYVWGGASPSGFDCSGFVLYVFNQLGVSLPHHAATQYGYGRDVPKSQLEPGDLVYFDSLGHNGIYIGGRQFIHAPHTGDVVKISSLDDDWYARNWTGARRL